MTKFSTYVLQASFLLVLIAACEVEETQKTSSIDIPSSYSEYENVEADTLKNPLYDISFSKDLVIRPTADNNLYTIGDVAVDSLGRIFISDRHQIRLFDSNGEYVTSFGGNGRGPGEFDNMKMLTPKVQGEKLFAYDDVLRRINVFNTDALEFSHSIPLSEKKWEQKPELSGAQFHRYFLTHDNLLIAGFKDPYNGRNSKKRQVACYLMNHEGAIISDKLFDQPLNTIDVGSGISGPVPPNTDRPFPDAADRATLVDVSKDGNIYSIWTEDIFIKIHSDDGAYSRAIYYPYSNSELDESDIVSSYKSNRRLYKRAQKETYPDTWPAVHQLELDDQGRLWIATITSDEQQYQWWVLQNSGEPLAKFAWSGQRLKRLKEPNQIKTIRGKYLYTVEQNDENEYKQLVRYKMTFNAKTN